MHRDGRLFPGQHAMKPISTRQLYRIGPRTLESVSLKLNRLGIPFLLRL
ncbi:hypothetical protein EMEDMD4_1010025 [Sinorhizobium medicae]|uniref:Uncharacterized protein n=1 Tax=Sinorhizobium medicae TaxID=110321 RepID=A0A508WT62_9HYPH|nr:hypothetical protein EMEDMD4_1010025 [Sinorhizobium medicae]